MKQDYHAILASLPDWDEYLMAESRLPGPRANLELAQAVADLAVTTQIEHWLQNGPDTAPTNTPQAFLAVCATIALGRLLAEGRLEVLEQLKFLANDPRWRIREAVAMALQRWGDADPDALFEQMRLWGQGSLLEQRAAAAGVCEPRLLGQAVHARQALDLLDTITASIVAEPGRKTDEFQTLRKGMGYCWSVAVAALPEEGWVRFERWRPSEDPDVAWIVRENLKKNRMKKVHSS